MIRKIGKVINHLLDDALYIEASDQVAEGDTVIIAGNRVKVSKICCERSGETLSVGPGDKFCLLVGFNPELVPAGTDVWLFSQKDTEVQPAAVVFHLYKKIGVLVAEAFETLKPGQSVFIGDLGPFLIASLEVNHETRSIVYPMEDFGLKLEGFDFKEATKGARIFAVSDAGQPAEIKEAITV